MNPITAHQFAGALQGVSQDMGALAGYEAKRQEDADAEALQARRDAANKAFQVMLFNAKAQQDQSQFEATKSFQQQELNATTDYRNRDLAEQTSYHHDALSQQAADRAAERSLRERGLAIEQQNADSTRMRAKSDEAKQKTDKQSAVIGTRLTAVGRLITSYQKQRDAELTQRMKAISADMNLMADPQASQAAQAKAEREVNAKYGPLIDKRQQEYDRLNAKFGELSGVNMGDAEEASTVGDVLQEQRSGPSAADDRMTAPPAEGVYPGDGGDGTGGSDGALPLAGTPGQNPGYQSAPGPGNTIKTLADIPPDAIAYLRSHPELIQQFDAKYGAGTGERILGKPNGGE